MRPTKMISALCAFLTMLLASSAFAQTWEIEVVDEVGNVGHWTSLALGPSGWPHISYWDATNDDLKYAYRDASGWHTETVDAAGDVGWHTSLALDRSGRPHISAKQTTFSRTVRSS